MTRHDIYEFLCAHEHAVLATVGPQARPEAALVGIVTMPSLEMVLDTSQLSRKYQNIQENPNVALVVGWQDKQTLQYEGITCEPVGPELSRCKQLYFSRFPDGRMRESWPDIAYLLVRPRWLRYSDYRVDPPLILEMILGD